MAGKRRLLSFLLIGVITYAIYIIVGVTLMSFGKVKEWIVFPKTVIAHGDHDTDNSRADADGPYVFYTDSSIVVKSIIRKDTSLGVTVETFRVSVKGKIKIQCSFSHHPEWNFTTNLKDTLRNEPAVYKDASSIVTISDIEGNFDAFRKLLIANAVMDSRFNWSFGNGHIVLTGDYFDRGLNVTECLWLIYHLEQQAEQAGGKVHFILGNHEIMNMQGDLRYVRNKYIENTYLIKENYRKWFTPDTELGRWLRTKNVAEQIGEYLFVHGGICKEIANMNISLEQLNALCKPWYFSNDSVFRASAPKDVQVLFDAKTSPFWYRGYVNKEASKKELEQVLRLYNATTMIVGHTVVDNVQTIYDGRLIAVDVKHAEGNIQALCIKKGKFYRVDTTGKLSAL